MKSSISRSAAWLFKKISKKELRELKVEREEFHGEWTTSSDLAWNSVDQSTSPFPVP